MNNSNSNNKINNKEIEEIIKTNDNNFNSIENLNSPNMPINNSVQNSNHKNPYENFSGNNYIPANNQPNPQYSQQNFATQFQPQNQQYINQYSVNNTSKNPMNIPIENMPKITVKKRNNTKGIIALILGILSLLFSITCFGPLLSIPGIIFGTLSRDETTKNNSKATIGIILSIIALVIFLLLFILYFISRKIIVQ